MKPLIVIPARLNSTRFPGKMLHEINGKPLIWWTAFQASLTGFTTMVATDAKDIADAVSDLPVGVVMTSEHCRNGTERVAEAVSKLNDENEDFINEFDMIVNWQGDNPLMPRVYVELMVQSFNVFKQRDIDFDVITPYINLDHPSQKELIRKRREDIIGGTTLVTKTDGSALYFSKEVLPHIKDVENVMSTPVKYHIGAYCYKPEALVTYSLLEEDELEKEEGLEQIRFITNDIRIFCIPVPHDGYYIEVNNPEDVPVVEAILLAGEDEIA